MCTIFLYLVYTIIYIIQIKFRFVKKNCKKIMKNYFNFKNAQFR